MNYLERYRQGRALGLGRRHAAYSALPTKVLACHAIVQGRPVIYRATIGHDPVIRCDEATNVGLLMANSLIIHPGGNA